VLENYCLLCSRSKLSIERAVKAFSELLDNDADYLPAVLGLATAFMIDKNQHKARNLLKRVGKLELQEHDGEDYEKAHLLLAKFFIDKARMDQVGGQSVRLNTHILELKHSSHLV
jgi:tetratricopeptide repeat protein 21B